MSTSESELKTLIAHFAMAKTVGEATSLTHGQPRFFVVPAQIATASRLGFIESPTFEKFVQSDKVYSQKAVLTKSGRDFCGITEVPAMAKPTTLF